MLTEMLLYSNGDESYIAAMTRAGYEFRSFPRTGSRGGGIGFVTRTTMSACIILSVFVLLVFKHGEMYVEKGDGRVA